jgi:hypothetical protein
VGNPGVVQPCDLTPQGIEKVIGDLVARELSEARSGGGSYDE